MNPSSTQVLLGLGSNLDDPLRQLRAAVDALRGVIQVQDVSQLYQTEPIGMRDQPDFLNLVVRGSTGRTVFDLHHQIHGIEREMGRVRAERNGPRRIDIDLLAFGPLCLQSDALQLPHPRLDQRRFVLVPLIDVWGSWAHPRSGVRAAELLERLDDESIVTPLGPLIDPEQGVAREPGLSG